MSKSSKGKHLTIEDREYIEVALHGRFTLQAIADRLGKDPTTISKEIKRNRMPSASMKSRDLVSCQHQKSCQKKYICNSSCKGLCKKCSTLNCYRVCPDYSVKSCLELNRFPHVCNGCTKKISCHSEKYHYRAKVAEANYRDLLVTTREGLDVTSDELDTLDKWFSPLIMRGQSIAHIYANHQSEIGYCERTLYNYFEKNAFTARNIDLPRKVKYKPRKKSILKSNSVSKHRIGRTYEHYTAFLDANSEVSAVEMDTVHGKRGGKVLLTLFFQGCALMVAILLDACTKECVRGALNRIYASLGPDVFRKTFPVLLTDNGSEFKDPESLENDCSNINRTSIFYCDPMASYQKPHVEKNHEYIRYVLPKGKSMDHLTQEQINRLMNHINSTARISLKRRSPFQLAQLSMDPAVFETFSIVQIPPDEVCLKPLLLKK